jgi:hypothetical protein
LVVWRLQLHGDGEGACEGGRWEELSTDII